MPCAVGGCRQPTDERAAFVEVSSDSGPPGSRLVAPGMGAGVQTSEI